jgi:hypothetical protein
MGYTQKLQFEKVPGNIKENVVFMENSRKNNFGILNALKIEVKLPYLA